MPAVEQAQPSQQQELLRLITAGSVDDGKSTLIGRLLYEAKGIYEDQLASVQRASSRRGAPAGEVDFSLFTDGLKAEREQNITIDVAYRYFSTPRRKFIIADTPGHEQYTRNMVTGASTASLMVILIDAAKGLLAQSKRHAFIASLLGIRHIVVVVNKMDLVDYRQEVFERIRQEFTEFAAKLPAPDITFVPASALKGDNVVTRSPNTPWYEGSTLLNHLETVHIASDRNLIDLRLPVQYVCRGEGGFRGYMGSVASGVIRPADQIVVLPSGVRSRVKSVLGPDGEVPEAFPPLSCCVVLEDEVDVSRGCMFVHPHNLPRVESRLEAMLVWMGTEPLELARPYLVKHTTRTAAAEVSLVRYRIDVHSLHRQEAATLAANEIGRAVVTLSQPIACDPYALNRATGAFILIDRVTHDTVGAGMILDRDPGELPAQTAGHVAAHPAGAGAGLDSPDQAQAAPRVTPRERARRLGHQPATVWLTGGTQEDRTAVAYALEKRLFEAGVCCCVLQEPSSKAADAAAMLNQAGLVAICAGACAPMDLDAAARRIGPARFIRSAISPGEPVASCVDRIVQSLRTGGIIP
jgi:bifunctional enzyme CysN/CysC